MREKGVGCDSRETLLHACRPLGSRRACPGTVDPACRAQLQWQTDSPIAADRTTGTKDEKTPSFSARGLAIALGTATSVQEVALDAEYRAERILVTDCVEAALPA
jgi:hypothetical protein